MTISSGETMRDTQYNVSPPREVWELMKHRRQQLYAIRQKARQGDQQRELDRELAQLDADIARGVRHYESMEQTELEKLGVALREQIEAHRE